MQQLEDNIKFPVNSLTLRQVLENTRRRYSMHPAMAFVGDEPILYEDFYNSVLAVSQLLADHGIGFGDRVAILAENSPHWPIAYFAITSMGAVAVPILADFHPQAIQHILNHSETKAIFVSEKLTNKLADTEADENLIVFNIESFHKIEAGISRDRMKEMREAGFREFRKLRTMARKAARLIPGEPREDDIAAIIYTSGTTGFSKGVVLTHRNIVSNAVLIQSIITISTEDRFLSFLPLAHTYECTLGMILPIMYGAQIYYLDKAPTARVLLPAFALIKPTVVASVPLIMEKIFKSTIKPKFTSNIVSRYLYSMPFMRRLLHQMAGKKLSIAFGGCLRIFAIGGAPLAPDVDLFLYESGINYGIGYGLTENSPLAAGFGPGHGKPYSCGKVLAGIKVKIDNPDPATQVGEILVKGATVMREYYKDPEMTEAVVDEDGWLHTGDLAYMDPEGYLFIKGRSKNMLLGASGENIYPEEIEAQILQHDCVLETLVYMQAYKLIARVHLDMAKLDERFGNVNESKRAELKEKLLEEIRAEANAQLAAFAKLHKIVEQAEPFEKTPTHKIKRYLYIDE